MLVSMVRISIGSHSRQDVQIHTNCASKATGEAPLRSVALSVSKWESASRHSSSINSLIFLDCNATDHERSLPRSLHSEQKEEEGKNTHPLQNTNACINAFCSKGFCGAFRFEAHHIPQRSQNCFANRHLSELVLETMACTRTFSAFSQNPFRPKDEPNGIQICHLILLNFTPIIWMVRASGGLTSISAIRLLSTHRATSRGTHGCHYCLQAYTVNIGQV